MKRFFLVPLIVLTGCGPAPERGTIIDYEIESAMITDVDHPKHFSVDIETESGLKFTNVAGSKHCIGSTERVKVGQTYNVVLDVYRYKNGKIEKTLDERKLNNLLCP